MTIVTSHTVFRQFHTAYNFWTDISKWPPISPILTTHIPSIGKMTSHISNNNHTHTIGKYTLNVQNNVAKADTSASLHFQFRQSDIPTRGAIQVMSKVTGHFCMVKKSALAALRWVSSEQGQQDSFSHSRIWQLDCYFLHVDLLQFYTHMFTTWSCNGSCFNKSMHEETEIKLIHVLKLCQASVWHISVTDFTKMWLKSEKKKPPSFFLQDHKHQMATNLWYRIKSLLFIRVSVSCAHWWCNKSLNCPFPHSTHKVKETCFTFNVNSNNWTFTIFVLWRSKNETDNRSSLEKTVKNFQTKENLEPKAKTR